MLIHFIVCTLFKGAVSNSVHTALNNMKVNNQLKYAQGRIHGLM